MSTLEETQYLAQFFFGLFDHSECGFPILYRLGVGLRRFWRGTVLLLGKQNRHLLANLTQEFRFVFEFLLYALRRIALLVEEAFKQQDDSYISLSIGSVFATACTPRSQTRKLLLPRPERIGLQLCEFGYFADAVIQLVLQWIFHDRTSLYPLR